MGSMMQLGEHRNVIRLYEVLELIQVIIIIVFLFFIFIILIIMTKILNLIIIGFTIDLISCLGTCNWWRII